MGFLDSMLGELVRRETGFNATKLIRRVGSKRLLMMGGAALAGGMLAQKSQRTNFGSAVFGGSSSQLPPTEGMSGASSLPPVPGAAAPAPASPNLPPIPAAAPAANVPAPGELPPLPAEEVGSAEDLEADTPSQHLLYAIVRTMVSAALADGELGADEKQAIEGHLDESGLDDRQQAQIRRDLVIPAAPAELAGMVPEGEDPETLLEFAVLVLRADGELKESELAWLEQLAQLLGVEEDRRAHLVQELAGDLFPAS